MSSAIYFDHNSTTPIDPLVVGAMTDCWVKGYANPASQHRAGQLARSALEQARGELVMMLGGRTSGLDTDRFIFTSGGTESNNLALIGLTMSVGGIEDTRLAHSPKPQILISAIEHPSIFGAAQYLTRAGFVVKRIPVDENGICSLSALDRLTDEPTALVSMMLANNETGVIQPIQSAATICRSKGILIHTDAVQAVGKIPVDFTDLGVDALSLAAHKFNGPRGVGGLLLKNHLRPFPLQHGGFQQDGIRPGTEDVAFAIGMAKALRLFFDDPSRLDQVFAWRDLLERGLLSRFPQCMIVGQLVPRLPGTINIAFPGVDRQAFLLAADMSGISLSTGSACASGSSDRSPVLEAMNLPDNIIDSAVRISLGVSNQLQEIEFAIDQLSRIAWNLSASS